MVSHFGSFIHHENDENCKENFCPCLFHKFIHKYSFKKKNEKIPLLLLGYVYMFPSHQMASDILFENLYAKIWNSYVDEIKKKQNKNLCER
jgi:hypothetical protein